MLLLTKGSRSLEDRKLRLAIVDITFDGAN